MASGIRHQTTMATSVLLFSALLAVASSQQHATEAEPSCGEGALLFQDTTCFWIDTSMVYNWTAAEAECIKRDMRMASIHSEEENQFIWDVIKVPEAGSSVIGFVDFDNTDVFEWTDGTAVDYTKWSYGEPDPYFPEFNCVIMGCCDEGEWFSTMCPWTHGVVCRGPALR